MTAPLRGHFNVAANLERLASTLVAVTLFVVFAFTADVFATSTNIRNILVQITIVAVVAAGHAIELLAGGLDLSVGSVVLLSEVVVSSDTDARLSPDQHEAALARLGRGQERAEPP